jgi:hypothetical protein
MDKRKINSVHVLYNKNGKWDIKKASEKTISGTYDTQKEAHKAAREVAKIEKLELCVHGKNGKIRIKDSFGNDPRNTKG